MAVIAVWKCDRDGKMFDDKKAAEAHDKMLELAANITQLIEFSIRGINEQHSEAIGLLLAERSEQLVKACKGRPEVLLEELGNKNSNSNVAELSSAAATG